MLRIDDIPQQVADSIQGLRLDLFAEVWYSILERSDIMAKSKACMSLYPKNPPEWYWINGLHDAGIVGVEIFEFPFEYNKFVGESIKFNSR